MWYLNTQVTYSDGSIAWGSWKLVSLPIRLGTMLSKATMVTSRWARWSTGWAMQFCVHTTVTTFTMAITMMHSDWTEKGRGKQLTKEERYDIILAWWPCNCERPENEKPPNDAGKGLKFQNFLGDHPRPPYFGVYGTIHAFLSGQSTSSYETPMTYSNVWRLVQCWRALARAWAPAVPTLFPSRLYMNNKTQQIITICDPGVT